MPVKKSTDNDFVDGANITESPEDWEWEVVSEPAPTKVIFDTIGDVFVGQYLGLEHVALEVAADGTDPSFDQFLFKGRDGERYSTATSYALKDAMEDVEIGQWVRLRYVKDIPTGRKLNPMKDITVDVRRP